MKRIDPLSKEAQKMMAHRIMREVKRQKKMSEGPDPILSALLFGIPIMIPPHHSGEEIRLIFISWEVFKGLGDDSCCGFDRHNHF